MKIVVSKSSLKRSLLRVINNSNNKNSYALYIFEKNNDTAFEKKWYQKQTIFSLDLREDISNYKFRLYTKNTENNQGRFVDYTFPDSIEISNNTVDFIDYLSFERTFEEISCFIDVFLEDERFFTSFIRVKHGSIRIPESNFQKICHQLLNKLMMDLNVNIVEVQNILKFLVYFLDLRSLNKNKQTLLKYFTVFDEKDQLFYKGVMSYRIGFDDIAKEYNFQLFKYKDELEYHQGGAISYINLNQLNEISPISLVEENRVFILNKLTCNGKGIMLMSSDYGYFKAYSEKTINQAIKHDNLLHFHLIFPSIEAVSLLDVDFFIKYNIGVSYEIKDVVNNPTYYSIARYLILKDIINTYESSVIVCDIDVSVDYNTDYVFEKLGHHKIGLVLSGRDLPWISCMAGFNYFGKETSNSFFLRKLNETLLNLFGSGRDLWMLDQVSLQLAIEENKDMDVIVDFRNYLDHTISQYSNRQAARNIAKRAVEQLKYER